MCISFLPNIHSRFQIPFKSAKFPFSLSLQPLSLLNQLHIPLHQTCLYKIGRCVRSRVSQWQPRSVWKRDRISTSFSSCKVFRVLIPIRAFTDKTTPVPPSPESPSLPTPPSFFALVPSPQTSPRPSPHRPCLPYSRRQLLSPLLAV